MFRIHSTETEKTFRLAIIGLLLMSGAALGVTIWVMVDFLKEQVIVEELIQQLPRDATETAEALAGELRWQFRLSALVVLNLIVTGIAVVLLWRAYRSSQESLRDIKSLAADVLGSMDQAVLTTDMSGRVSSINNRGLEFFEADMDCVGRPLEELSSRIPLEDFRNAWSEEMSPSLIQDFPVTLGGAERTLRAFCQELNDYQGHSIGFVLQLRDVTRRVLMEERIRRMERYMGLGSLAVGLHHEIKNPLAALSLHVQLLEEQVGDGNATDDMRQIMQVIKSEVDRVGDVLESFRDFASVGRLRLSPVDLAQLVHRQVELVAPQAQQRYIEVKVQLPPSLPEIEGDHVRLEQVLLNLLTNSMEAMPDGGEILIAVSVLAQSVELTVRDTGCGIPADMSRPTARSRPPWTRCGGEPSTSLPSRWI